MATWLEDRMTLKQMAREEWPGLRPICRTLVYVCIAQMRGKLHMKGYRERNSGWKRLPDGSRWWQVRHLADQREWIWWVVTSCEIPAEQCRLLEIASRVFNQSWEPARPWIRVVSAQPQFPSDEVLASIPIGNVEAKC